MEAKNENLGHKENDKNTAEKDIIPGVDQTLTNGSETLGKTVFMLAQSECQLEILREGSSSMPSQGGRKSQKPIDRSLR